MCIAAFRLSCGESGALKCRRRDRDGRARHRQTLLVGHSSAHGTSLNTLRQHGSGPTKQPRRQTAARASYRFFSYKLSLAERYRHGRF